MNNFTPLIKNISEKLDIPQPAKSRILLEIQADIEDSYDWFISRGKTEAQATEAVQEKFAPSADSINELTKIHQSNMKGWLDQMPNHMQNVWERVLFVIIMMVTVGIGIRLLITTSLTTNASIFIWPVLLTGFAIIIIGLVKVYYLYIKKDHNIRTLRNGLDWLLFLGGGSLSFAALGYYWELYRIGSLNLLLDTKLLYLINLQDEQFAGSIEIITQWLIKCSSMILGSLFVALLAALIWFVLLNKVIKIEISEAEVLIHVPSGEK